MLVWAFTFASRFRKVTRDAQYSEHCQKGGVRRTQQENTNNHRSERTATERMRIKDDREQGSSMATEKASRAACDLSKIELLSQNACMRDQQLSYDTNYLTRDQREKRTPFNGVGHSEN